MISSRSLEDLEPDTRARALQLLQRCRAAGIDLLVTSTYRDFEAQAALFAIGRTTNGAPCRCKGRKNPLGTCPHHPRGLTTTNAVAGQSWHNWRRAFDVVPLRHGKPVWDTSGNGIDDDPTDDDKDNRELWERIGAAGKAVGLEWAGAWRAFPEFPHFQYTGGQTWAALLKAHPKGLPT